MFDFFGREAWDGQQRIIDSVLANPRTAAKTGQKTGKTDVAGSLAIWWPLFHGPGSWTHITSPTFETTKKTLYKEICNLIETANDRLSPSGWQLPRPAVDPLTGWKLRHDRGIDAIATKKAPAAAGRSGDKQLYIIDEASGYERALWEALEGNCSGGGRILATGNPTQTSGPFFDCFHSGRTVWHPITIDSRTNPNFFGKRIPGLAEPESIALMIEQYGEDSPFIDVRVRGDFPKQSGNAVVQLYLVERSTKSWELSEDEPITGRLSVGIDVARYGDDNTAIYVRRGWRVLGRTVANGYDASRVVGALRELLEEHRGPQDTGGLRPRVKVDGTGNGSGVVDLLRVVIRDQVARGMDAEWDVIAVDSACTAIQDTKYVRTRDELWFGIRDWLKEGGQLPPNMVELEQELVAPVYSFGTLNRFLVESKDDIKKKIRRSPDEADALGLCIYEPPSNDVWLAVMGGANGPNGERSADRKARRNGRLGGF